MEASYNYQPAGRAAMINVLFQYSLAAYMGQASNPPRLDLGKESRDLGYRRFRTAS